MEEQIRRGPSLLESLWRYRVIVMGVTLAMGVVGYLVGLQEAESYEAEGTLFLADPNLGDDLQGIVGSRISAEEYVPRQSARIQSRAVLQEAVELTGNRVSVDDLEENLDIDASIETLEITILVQDATAEGSAELVNAIAEAYRSQRREQEELRAEDAVAELRAQQTRLEEERNTLQQNLEADPGNIALPFLIQSLDARILDISGRIDATLLEVRLRGDGIESFETANPPEFPARPRPRLTAISFAFLGAVAAAMWAYWYAFKSQRVTSRTDPELVLGVPPLGEIPLYRMTSEDALTGLLRVDPAAAEAYEFVLSSIEFALADLDGKSLLITSTLPGDGKTTTTLQLAIAASRDRRRVVLVDADIRARGLTRVLGADDRVGLSDLAALDLEPNEVLRRYKFSEQSQIPVVTAGQRRGDPAALLRTHAFRKAMDRIEDSAELLIVDSSPLLAVADATIVAGSVDGIVIVVSHGTPFSELQKVRERLKFVSTPLLGYVFNRSDSSTAGAYGYGYGVAEDDDGQRRLLPGSRSRQGARNDEVREPRPRRRGDSDDGPVGHSKAS
ncbi:tyrosine-protein kinase domain-containing protein [Euzebya rosea]|uniref:tyrosine-protein kinase domain-containing protein n=1 Tax=Euzebya rosea TaxID=2052804 RepID=UPI0013008F76|nr:tyrosine-protein kinase domain-containing protein [Euzebya rosea]